MRELEDEKHKLLIFVDETSYHLIPDVECEYLKLLAQAHDLQQLYGELYRNSVVVFEHGAGVGSTTLVRVHHKLRHRVLKRHAFHAF